MANIIQSKEEIKDKLIQIIKENVLEFQEIEIDLDTKINTQKSLNSITFIYLMCKIEEAFEIKISEKKWIKMETVGDILKEILRGCKCIQ